MKCLHSSNLAILHPLTLTILGSSNLGISYFTALWISDVSSPCIPQSYCIWICCVFCVWGPVWAGVFVGFANSGPRLSACCRAVLWGAWLGFRAALCGVVWCGVVLCCAVLCCLCCALPRCAVMCCALLCYAGLDWFSLCWAVLCCAVQLLWSALLCFILCDDMTAYRKIELQKTSDGQPKPGGANVLRSLALASFFCWCAAGPIFSMQKWRFVKCTIWTCKWKFHLTIWPAQVHTVFMGRKRGVIK